jgi:hypothetical protein
MRTVELLLGVDSRATVGSQLNVAHVRVGRVSRNEGLRLRGDRREDAVLVEALAVGASSLSVGLEA